jgi:hypothetical protein
VPARTTGKIDLTAGLIKFYPELPKPGETWLRLVYCVRVTFRNTVTKQRFVRYVLTSPSLILPDAWGASEKVASGGGYDTSLDILRLRDAIRAHQASFFDDQPEEFFRN